MTQCVAEQWTDSRWDGGHDHGDELPGGSDGDARRNGGDQREGGEQHDDHGDDAGASAGAVTVTVTGMGRAGA